MRHVVIWLALASCSTPAAAPATSPAARELAALKAKIMTADYRADLDGLAKLRDEAARYESDAELGHVAYYWAGFAGWRLAMNGGNVGMANAELEQHLLQAASAMYFAIRARGDFADAYAAAAGINGRILGLHKSEKTDAVSERAALTFMLLARAQAIAPDNPRVLWIAGGFQLIMPPERGGGAAPALATFRKMLALAERAGTDPQSPLPDWGRPEAVMMMVHAYLAMQPPDVAAARERVRATLALRPDWAYVRDKLAQQVEQTKP
jgi:hypothetical protein